MKIGFSFGRCVRDIVKGDVAIDDVTVIVAATCIETEEQLEGVIEAYLDRLDYLYGLDPAECHAVARKLWNTGKLHQPRKAGAYVHPAAEQYVWVDLFPSLTDADETVKEAWCHYRAMLNLIHGAAVPRRPETV